MAVNDRIQNLIREWRDIQSLQGFVGWRVASYAARVEAEFQDATRVRAFWWDTLGVRAGATIDKHARMAAAVRVVPDEAVWRAAGWPAVEKIARIASAKQRREACARLVAESQKSAKVGPAVTDRVLAEVAPEVFVPKPPAKETKKDREANKREAAKRADEKAAREQAADALVAGAASAVAAEAKRERQRADTLAAEFRRLIAGPLPILAEVMSPEARAAAGVPASAKKARAS